MKLLILSMLVSFSVYSQNWTGDALPMKYISSCEFDLNNDKKADMVILLESIQGKELIALIQTNNNYQSHLLWRGLPKSTMHLKCEQQKFTVKETSAAGGLGRVFETNGSVITLFKPESSSFSYFIKNGKFIEVVTAD